MLTSTGSSPRVRGKRRVGGSLQILGRIIPARAGQTRTSCLRAQWPTDHPRACGANFLPTVLIQNKSGSSPRVRGKRTRVRRQDQGRRIIPARAGQTPRPIGRRTWYQDHPRACGANEGCRQGGVRLLGSSPRVRGKLYHVSPVMVGIRIIPARAGQTRPPCMWFDARADHPRACGANVFLFNRKLRF